MTLIFYSDDLLINLEWMVIHDFDDTIETGKVVKNTESYYYDLFVLLLAIGSCNRLVSYNIDFRLKKLHKSMREKGVTFERATKAEYFELKYRMTNPPKSLNETKEAYFKMQEMFNNILPK